MNEQAKPRPRRSADGSGGSDGNGLKSPRSPLEEGSDAASAQRSITSGMVTPGGMAVWVMPMLPSRSELMRRICTGSIPSASASLLTWLSAAKAAWGAPKPRNAPAGVALVYTAMLSISALGTS